MLKELVLLAALSTATVTPGAIEKNSEYNPNPVLELTVCKALPYTGPRDINGFPVDDLVMDKSTCRQEKLEITNSQDPNNQVQITPTICAIMGMSQAPYYQESHPGWYVIKVKCENITRSF